MSPRVVALGLRLLDSLQIEKDRQTERQRTAVADKQTVKFHSDNSALRESQLTLRVLFPKPGVGTPKGVMEVLQAQGGHRQKVLNRFSVNIIP